MGSVEAFVILTVAALYFPVMTRRKRTDKLVAYSVFLLSTLEYYQCFFNGSGKTLGELTPIVGPDTFDWHGETLQQVFQKLSGKIGAVLLESFHVTPAGIFIDRGILVKLFSLSFINQTTGGNELHVDLYSLSGIGHLLIRFGDIFEIREFFSCHPLFLKETIETGDRALITPLHEFYPENDQPGVRITPAHIPDEFDLFGSMLVRMIVRTSGPVTQGIQGSVIAFFSVINILAVGFKFHGRFRNAILLSVFN